MQHVAVRTHIEGDVAEVHGAAVPVVIKGTVGGREGEELVGTILVAAGRVDDCQHQIVVAVVCERGGQHDAVHPR